MKLFVNKSTVFPFLFGVLFPLGTSSGASSQETNRPQSSISKPSEDIKSQSSFTPVPLKEAKAVEKPKLNPKNDKHKKKHKPHAGSPKEKPKPKTTPRTPKEAPSSAPPKVSESAAQSATSGWFLGVRGAYVPGVIGELGYQFNTTFKLRLIGAGFVQYFKTFSVDNQVYNKVRIKPLKIGLMADWHLWKNGFRLTGGIAYNGDRIRLNHTITGTLFGQPANVYGNVTARYQYRWAVVPYLGLGYDTGSLGGSGISLSADAGFWFQGKVRSSVNFTGTGQGNDMIINNLKLHTANLINKNKLMRTVPMVSLGIRYMF